MIMEDDISGDKTLFGGEIVEFVTFLGKRVP